MVFRLRRSFEYKGKVIDFFKGEKIALVRISTLVSQTSFDCSLMNFGFPSPTSG